MTSRTTGDSMSPDGRFDAAWRNASREEPPAALDASILAAAAREVGAGPQRLDARVAMRARRWWPLAAAATVAALAVGVVRLATHDEVGAPAVNSTIVSDIPAQSAKKASAQAPASTAEPATPAATAEATPAARKDAASPSGTATAGPAQSSTARVPPQAPGTVTGAATGQHGRATGGAAPTEPTIPAPHSAPTPAPSPQRSDSSSRAAGMAEPFPAQSPNDALSAGARMPTAPASTASPAAVSPPAASPSPSGASSAGRSDVESLERREMSVAAHNAAQESTPPAAPGPVAQRAAGAAARPSMLAKSATDSASEDAARIKDRAALPVADWIALIRRLRAEGANAEAAKELTAFRAVHSDHDKLLPADLRDWRPANH